MKFFKLGILFVILFSVNVKTYAENIIDVLVLYTQEATETRNGRSIEARAASYIAYSNKAYENSNVDIKLRLVGLEQYDNNYTYVTSENLDAFRKDQQVAALRQKYGADLVTLLNLRQSAGNNSFVCGIGYIGAGNDETGTLYNYVSSLAFSLVGVNCDLGTFTHELGHNMGLGHSYQQDSNGGVWDWARGHGVQGEFVTNMAYGSAYGTNNRVQVVSNPSLNICNENACGVNRSTDQGADAAYALNAVASQIAQFMPTEIASESGGESEEPEPEICANTPVNNNLIENAFFDQDLSSWQTLFEASSLQIADQVDDCINKVLLVFDRTQTYGNAYQALDGKMNIGSTYRIRGRFALNGGNTRDTMRFAIRKVNAAGTSYQYLPELSITSSEFTSYDQEFILEGEEDFAEVGIVFYGPEAETNIALDDISIVLVQEAEVTVEVDPVVIADGFEQDAQGWDGYWGAQISYSRTANSGSYSLLSVDRDNRYGGPAKDVTGLIGAEIEYDIAFNVGFNGVDTTQTVWAYLYLIDDDGARWIKLTEDEFSPDIWNQVAGSFSIEASGSITLARLHIMGPAKEASLYLDNFSIIAK